MCINSGSKSYICGLFSIFPNISNFNYRNNWPCDYWLIVIKSLCAFPIMRLFVLISKIPWDEHAWINDIILFVKRQVSRFSIPLGIAVGNQLCQLYSILYSIFRIWQVKCKHSWMDLKTFLRWFKGERKVLSILNARYES